MDVSGQLHASAPLPLREELPVPLGYVVGSGVGPRVALGAVEKKKKKKEKVKLSL
jgi:hypothetical protein